MGVKEFLKPSKGKILASFLLFGISLIFIFLGYILYPVSEILFFPLILAVTLYISIIPLIFFIPFHYVFACYINRNKKWFKGIIIYLIAFMIFSAALFLAIIGYNYTVGRFCFVDSNCFAKGGSIIGPGSAFNHIYIPLVNPHGPYGGAQVDIVSGYGICENNRCELFLAEYANSIDDCERVEGFVQSKCYYKMAKELNDQELCNKIEEVRSGWKGKCISEFKDDEEG